MSQGRLGTGSSPWDLNDGEVASVLILREKCRLDGLRGDKIEAPASSNLSP